MFEDDLKKVSGRKAQSVADKVRNGMRARGVKFENNLNLDDVGNLPKHYGKINAARAMVDKTEAQVDREMGVNAFAETDRERRMVNSYRLAPRYRDYYLRCHGYQLHPVLFVMFFWVKLALCYLYLSFLKVRRKIGIPQDDIDLRKIIFLPSPTKTALEILNPGGKIYKPNGEESITDSTILTVAVNNTTIKGAGVSSIYKLGDGANSAYMIRVNGKNHTVIESVKIDNNVSNQTGGHNTGIKIEGASENVIIRDVWFTGGGRTSGTPEGYAIFVNSGYNIMIENCFADAWTGWGMIVLANCEKIIISGCIFDGMEDSAIECIVSCQKATITGNIFCNIGNAPDLKGHAVSINTSSSTLGEYPHWITVSNNVCYRCFGDVIIAEKGFFINISDNVIWGNLSGTQAVQDGDMGISASCADVVIADNVVSNVGNHCISIDGTHQNPQYRKVCTGNYCLDAGQNTETPDPSGIWVNNTQFALIANNFCINTEGTQEYGIRSAGTSQYNFYIGNYCHGNNTSQMSWAANKANNVIGPNFMWTSSIDDVEMTGFSQLSDINPNGFGGHKVQFQWYYNNVAASLTEQKMNVNNSGSNMQQHLMVFAGSILGITIRTNEARTAGTLTAEVFVDSAGTGLQVSLDGSHGSYHTVTQAKDTDACAVQTSVDVRITTDAGWLPVTADIIVDVVLEI